MLKYKSLFQEQSNLVDEFLKECEYRNLIVDMFYYKKEDIWKIVVFNSKDSNSVYKIAEKYFPDFQFQNKDVWIEE